MVFHVEKEGFYAVNIDISLLKRAVFDDYFSSLEDKKGFTPRKNKEKQAKNVGKTAYLHITKSYLHTIRH